MSGLWPTVRLEAVLHHRKEFITIDELTTYQRPRVTLHAQGIVLRDKVPGSLIKTKKQQVCRAGEFLVAEIDAKVGGFGIVPPTLEGAIVSSHYFLFTIDEQRLNRGFLDYFIRTPLFSEQVAAQGSTNYAAIRPAHVLSYEMPLPPLVEQLNVVARLDALAVRAAEARQLRERAIDETELLVSSKASSTFRAAMAAGSVPLDSVAILERGKFHHRPRNEPRFFGGAHPWIQIGEIESSNKYIRKWTQTLNDDGLAISKKFPRGTVLISIAATIGAVGILDFDCCVPDSIVGVTPKPGTESDFLYHYLRYLRGHLEEVAPQSAQKNINLGILTALPVPRLSVPEQRRIATALDGLQEQVDMLSQLQAQTATELDALMPAILDRAFKGEL